VHNKRFATTTWTLSPALSLILVLLLTACGDADRQDSTTPPGGDDVALDAHDDAIDPTTDVDPDDVSTEGDADVPPVPDADDIDPDTTDGDVDPDATDVETDAPDVEEPPLVDPFDVDGEAAYDLVDPFIGTGGFGFAYAGLTPAAQLPLGMVKVGPDTTQGGVHIPLNHFSGYYADDLDVRGFSHLHFVGTGVADYGNLRVLPVATLPDEPWRAFEPMEPGSQQAAPGWYRVRLSEAQVDVTLVATLRGALHSYTLTQPGSAILIDPASSVTDSGMETATIRATEQGFEGSLTYRGSFVGRTRPFTLWFTATVEPPPQRVGAWGEEGWLEDADEATGAQAGLALFYDDVPEAPVVLRVAVSYVDADGATRNWDAELADQTEASLLDAARDAWVARLDQVHIRAREPVAARMFYTALYNAYRMPSVLMDVDGRYRGLDGESHEVDGFTYYSDLSLWDTFRTLHPWYELTEVSIERDVLRSLLMMAEQYGRMPRWPAALSETGSMIGASANMLFSGAQAKGIDGIDYDEAFDALWRSDYGDLDPASGELPTSGRGDIRRYAELGYLPSDEIAEAPSKTLEYAYADRALAWMAERLGHDDHAAYLDERALSFERIFDPERRFFWSRLADGTFADGIRETAVFMGGGAYTEGSAWHWRFYALQDADRLFDLFGGPEAAVEEMVVFFERSGLGSGTGPVRDVLPNSYYWHGNEPTIHVAPLFALAGRVDLARNYVRAIQLRMYGDGPDGLPGNDDGGTMSSWYLFTSIGLYPIAGTDAYILLEPRFERIEIRGDGPHLTIVAPQAPASFGSYEVMVDGVIFEEATLTHDQLDGATLTFTPN